LTLPIFHYGPPCPSGPSSLEDRLSKIRLKRQSRWINDDLVNSGNDLGLVILLRSFLEMASSDLKDMK
jgi:hypothetical protein